MGSGADVMRVANVLDKFLSQSFFFLPSHSTSDEFYSLFYLGLYCEAQGEMGKAASYMRSATKTRYATGLGAGDYMATCARVHCKLRGWT